MAEFTEQYGPRGSAGIKKMIVPKTEIMALLREVIDPELDINIVDLGLVYRVETGEDKIDVDFTLTYPGCPLGDVIHDEIIDVLNFTFGVKEIHANLVWKPRWGPEMMSEEARVVYGYPI